MNLRLTQAEIPEHLKKYFRPAKLQAKSLAGIPWRFMLAMLDHGWICRNVVVWKKKSAMPTSARDRMRCSWEPCFVFVKKGRYYSDVEAVRKPHSDAYYERAKYGFNPTKGDHANHYGDGYMRGDAHEPNPAGANPGDVLTLGPQPSKIEHYAMYPVRLPLWFMRWLMPRKVCSECGMAWARAIETTTPGKSWHDHSRDENDGQMQVRGDDTRHAGWKDYARTTLGWQPRCECGAEATGPTVIDPYGGPGTTAAAAEYLWTHKAEGFDTVLTNVKNVPTRPDKSSKVRGMSADVVGCRDPGRHVRTGTPTNVYCEWVPGKAIMLDLDPKCEDLYPERRDECFNALSDGPGMKAPETPLFAETNP